MPLLLAVPLCRTIPNSPPSSPRRLGFSFSGLLKVPCGCTITWKDLLSHPVMQEPRIYQNTILDHIIMTADAMGPDQFVTGERGHLQEAPCGSQVLMLFPRQGRFRGKAQGPQAQGRLVTVKNWAESGVSHTTAILATEQTPTQAEEQEQRGWESIARMNSGLNVASAPTREVPPSTTSLM